MEKLTKQEEEVMLQVWRLGNCTTKDIREMVSFFAKEDKISPEDLKDIISEIERGKDTE